MALVTVPNTGSILSASGQVASSLGRWTNMGFVATPGGSGSMMWYSGSSEASGSPLFPIVCASGHQTFMSPLYMAPCGLFAACISGGCAIIWVKGASV